MYSICKYLAFCEKEVLVFPFMLALEHQHRRRMGIKGEDFPSRIYNQGL